MTKTLTKKQFRIEPKIQLLPGDKCLINGNMYGIKVEIYEDLVTLTKI